jgi:hypothetical protein
MKEERRGRNRYAVKCPVLMVTSRGIQKGETGNLSGTGACIRCRDPLRPGDDFFLEIEFPNEFSLRIPAYVVWTSEPAPDDETMLSRMGVRFRWELKRWQD